MNFTNNKTSIENLLLKNHRYRVKKTTGEYKKEKDYYTGMYIFGRDYLTNRTSNVFKIGVAYGKGGIFKRLTSQYQICFPYPDEFHLYFFIITSPSNALKIERIVLDKLRPSKSTNKRLKEWREVSTFQELKDNLVEVMNDNPELWSHLVIFSKHGWRIADNDESILKQINRPSASRSIIRPLRDTTKSIANVIQQREVIKSIPITGAVPAIILKAIPGFKRRRNKWKFKLKRPSEEE